MIFLIKISKNFCNFKFYKDIASFLKIKVPLLNEEIKLNPFDICLIHGLKKIIVSENESEGTQVIKYVHDEYHEQELTFQKAIQTASELRMDLSVIKIDEGNIPILGVSFIRQNIYSEYFRKHIKNPQLEFEKTIRLSQKIQANDLNTKVQNVRRLFNQGERKFRLVTFNDSQKSLEVLENFAKMFNLTTNPKIEKIKSKKGRRSSVTQERWMAILNFKDQIPVQTQFVNRKWRKKKIQQKYRKSNEMSVKEFSKLTRIFEKQNIQTVRELYSIYKGLGVQLPQDYQEIVNLENKMKTDKLAIYKDLGYEYNFQNIKDDEYENEEERKLYQQKMKKHNKQHFGGRSVEDIISEMQKLKEDGYQSQAYKVSHFKKLKKQLQDLIKSNRAKQL